MATASSLSHLMADLNIGTDPPAMATASSLASFMADLNIGSDPPTPGPESNIGTMAQSTSDQRTVSMLNVKHKYCFVPQKMKECYLVCILNKISSSKSLIFTSERETRLLTFLLQELGFKAIAISGKMTQPQRLRALNKFRTRRRNILVCTTVTSRGLDIPSVNLVINYDVPTNFKDYINRVGRAARAGRHGKAITVVDQYNLRVFLPVFREIEDDLGRKLHEYRSVEQEVLVRREQVSHAKRIAQKKVEESNRNTRRRNIRRIQID